MNPDFTTVCGVDAKHLKQLSWVWPTWKRHKPSLLNSPMLIFRDREQIRSDDEVRAVVDHPNLTIVPWPIGDVSYIGTKGDKWTDPQRYCMLAGFVYIPALFVATPYWLKLDTDTVATGQDVWIDSEWFKDNPAIVSHPWSFTKPADQMQVMDRWVAENPNEFNPWFLDRPPLNLIPKPGASRISHPRIISWAAFFSTGFTIRSANSAAWICGNYHLPIPSQDGYLWYLAKRAGLEIVRIGMKKRGWKHRSSEKGIKEAIEEAMK